MSPPLGAPPLPAPAAAPGNAALGEHLKEIERDAIVKALEKTRYNKTAAAKLLGTSFRALRYLIKKLGSSRLGSLPFLFRAPGCAG